MMSKTIMLYTEALEFLYGLTNFEKSSGPPERIDLALKEDRTRALLAAVGNPHERYKIIHVTGTKGKGSTAAMLESCLRQLGLKTGLYSSPHLSSFRERIRVAGQYIPAEVVALLAEKVKTAMESVPGVTAFEAITALAFLHFSREDVEWAVVEVGMGGAGDATNVVLPQVSVITSISFDHMQWLGNSLTEIAAKKAGIIKPGVPVVSSGQMPEAAAVIDRVAHEQGSALTIVGRHWRWTPGHVSLIKQDFEVKQVSRIRSREKPFVNDLEGRYEIALLGSHQLENATTVIAAMDVLRDPLVASGARDFGVKTIREGLRTAAWPGRFEVLRGDPPVIVDGAHNVDSVNKLAMTLAELFPGKRWTFVFGCYRDKTAEGMLKALNARAARWVFTQIAGNPRAMAAEDLLALGRTLNVRNATANANLAEVINGVYEGNEAVCVCGSISLVGDARVKWALRSGDAMPPVDTP
jgi:dihydrofolate synthase / folylpolyglutamate synthase